jgi:restriction system protein
MRRQRTLADLAALSWEQFEEVIADAFRRHGCRVWETGGRGTADDGVDLVLARGGERTVVQAKHWRAQRLGVQTVRELYGV